VAKHPVIDGFELASAGATQRGVVPVRDFARLRDLLASEAGDVTYAVEGTRDELGRPSLRVSVSAKLQLRCQRCLEPMEAEVQSKELLVLASTEAEIEAGPEDGPDRVLAGKDMHVLELIEDELILAVPYAPRHAACQAAPDADADKAGSPFAGLRGMLRGKH
jgi:uncharacterized protein